MSKAANGEGSVYQRKGWSMGCGRSGPDDRPEAVGLFSTGAQARKMLRRMASRADEGRVVLDAGAT